VEVPGIEPEPLYLYPGSLTSRPQGWSGKKTDMNRNEVNYGNPGFNVRNTRTYCFHIDLLHHMRKKV
jgi:hypothetical protein